MTEATLNVRDAAARIHEAIILGAGPAGAMAALLLARRGVDVLLIDRRRFPRVKVCGGCLNRRAISLLTGVGLQSSLASLPGHRLDSLHLAAGSRHVRLALPAGIAVERSELDAMLVREAIRSGAAFLPETTGRIGRVDREYRLVRAEHRGEHRILAGRVVLAATGLTAGNKSDPELACSEWPHTRIGVGSRTDRFPDRYEPGTIYMAVGVHGYVGLTRFGSESLNIAAAVDRTVVGRQGVAATCAGIIRNAGFPVTDSMLQGDWLGTVGLTRARRRAAGERLFAIGDAAGFVEPFTGEGVAWALESGCRVVGPAERASVHWTMHLADEWNLTWRRSIARRQRLCRVLSRLLRRPRLTSGAVMSLAYLPALGQPIIRSLNGVTRP